MSLLDLVATSRAVTESSGRLDKVEQLSAFLKRTRAEEIEIAVSFLSGTTRQGRIGIGGAVVRESRQQPCSSDSTLELSDVDEAFARIAGLSGSGSSAAKAGVLRHLLGRATDAEQGFIVRLLFGELRQGALEGVLVEAVARASAIAPAVVRRAAMMAGGLPQVARAALTSGASALDGFVVKLLQPVQPMLADSAADVNEAILVLGEAALEYKLDGARIQVHKMDDEVRVFSRALRDVTVAVPEVVDIVRRLPSRSVILDGEAIALRADGGPQPFQITMRRFGRKLEVERLRQDLPIAPYFFDCLYLDEAPLLDEPLSRRVAALDRLVGPEAVVPRIVTSRQDQAIEFVARAIAAGHEGVVAKALGAGYAAGRRGQAWLKVKQARTLDLVVLAVEWGSGRRRGLLSNLHLGARDAERGGFVMLGKTFKGLTDEMLARQTERLLGLEIARDAYTVHVRPELVVEIAFNDIQESQQYPGRLALRFARVKRYREDKTAAGADTFATIQSIYRQMTGLEPPVR
jgi:DNA ligase-1